MTIARNRYINLKECEHELRYKSSKTYLLCGIISSSSRKYTRNKKKAREMNKEDEEQKIESTKICL